MRRSWPRSGPSSIGARWRRRATAHIQKTHELSERQYDTKWIWSSNGKGVGGVRHSRHLGALVSMVAEPAASLGFAPLCLCRLHPGWRPAHYRRAMGIKNLMKLIQASAPAAVKEITQKELMGRTIAIDASMTIYSFLVSCASKRMVVCFGGCSGRRVQNRSPPPDKHDSRASPGPPAPP